MALVVSGQALGYILADKRLQHQFLSLAMAATAVVACRVSPPQKAAIVRMVLGRVKSFCVYLDLNMFLLLPEFLMSLLVILITCSLTAPGSEERSREPCHPCNW
jgi:hypothetical protein